MLLFFLIASLSGKGFTPETLIWTTKGYTQIKDIKPGDNVLSNKGDGEIVETKVVGVIETPVKEYLEIRIENTIIHTDFDQEFRLPLKNAWKEAKDLQKYDFPLQHQSFQNKIASIKKVKQEKVLYELSLSQYNNFYVSELKVNVHNFVFGIVLAFEFTTLADITFAGISAIIGLGALALGIALDKEGKKQFSAGIEGYQNVIIEEEGFGRLENETDYANFYERHLRPSHIWPSYHPPEPPSNTLSDKCKSLLIRFKRFFVNPKIPAGHPEYADIVENDPSRQAKVHAAKRYLQKQVEKKALQLSQEELLTGAKLGPFDNAPLAIGARNPVREPKLTITCDKKVLPVPKDGSEILDIPLENGQIHHIEKDALNKLAAHVLQALEYQRAQRSLHLENQHSYNVEISSLCLDETISPFAQKTWAHNPVEKIIECAEAAITGFVDGAVNAVDYALHHPLKTAVNVVAGKYLFAYHAAKIGYEVAQIGVQYAQDREKGKKRWKEYTTPAREFIHHFVDPEIELAQKIGIVIALMGEWKTNNILFNELHALQVNFQEIPILAFATVREPLQSKFIASLKGERKNLDSREIILPKVKTYEQARNQGLKIIGEVDPHTGEVHFGKMGVCEGKIAGREWHNGKVTLRLDYAPDKGPHFNITDYRQGKGTRGISIAIPFEGTEKTVASLLKHLNK